MHAVPVKMFIILFHTAVVHPVALQSVYYELNQKPVGF